VQGENQFHKLVLWLPNVGHTMWVPTYTSYTHTHTHTHTHTLIFRYKCWGLIIMEYNAWEINLWILIKHTIHATIVKSLFHKQLEPSDIRFCLIWRKKWCSWLLLSCFLSRCQHDYLKFKWMLCDRFGSTNRQLWVGMAQAWEQRASGNRTGILTFHLLGWLWQDSWEPP